MLFIIYGLFSVWKRKVWCVFCFSGLKNEEKDAGRMTVAHVLRKKIYMTAVEHRWDQELRAMLSGPLFPLFHGKMDSSQHPFIYLYRLIYE